MGQCRTWEYPCRVGGCVQGYSRCDGHFQCDDGSDEKGCLHIQPMNPLAEGSCGEGLFQCRDGTCIFKNWKCDYEVDCRDGSDEVTCPDDQGTYVALTNIAAAAVASTVAVILIGLAVASIVHLYRKRMKADTTRAAVGRPPVCRDAEDPAATMFPLPPPSYATYNEGYVVDPCAPPAYGQCVAPPPLYSESYPVDNAVVDNAVANSVALEDANGKEPSLHDGVAATS